MPTRFSSAATVRRVLALALPLLVFVFVLCVYGARYHTNDDATLSNIAAGAYGDSLHMVYVNILFSAMLRPLYALAGTLNWYVIVQYILMYISCVALTNLALKKLGLLAGSCLSLAVMLPFSTDVLYIFQYVKSSGLLLAAGLVLIAVSLGNPNRDTALGIFLALMGSMLRWQNFLAMGGMSAAMLLGRFSPLNKREKYRAVATMLVLFALVFGAKTVDILAYRMDDGWAAYTEYNAARTAFSDYAVYQTDHEINTLASCDVTDVEYYQLRIWDFFDPVNFPTERISELVEHIPSRTAEAIFKDTVKKGFGLLHNGCYCYPFVIILLVGLFLLQLNRKALAWWGTAALFGLMFLYLQIRGRFPNYVEVPMLLAFVLYSLVCLADGDLRISLRPAVYPIVCAVMLTICLPSLRQYVLDSRAYHNWAGADEMYFAQMNEDKENLYLLSTEAINVAAGLDIWHPRTDRFYSNIVAFGGWLSNAPTRTDALAAYGLVRPIVDGVDKENVYFDYHNVHDAAAYASEQLGVAVEVVWCGSNDFAPYQLRTVTAPAQD